jgi:Ras-related GTP-binding protein C/D
MADSLADSLAYENDDNDENEIIILYLGWKRSGKTTIKERVFDGLQSNQINYVELTQDVIVTRFTQSFAKIRIIDYPGCKNFLDDIPDPENWAIPVDKGGLGIGGPNANLAVIYVIDAQDQNCYPDALHRMMNYASALNAYNKGLKFEIFLHKVENMNDDETHSVYEETSRDLNEYDETLAELNYSIHFTSSMDETIFDATSKVIQKLIPEQAQLENLLNLMSNKASVEKAYLFDVRTKLYIATDSVQPNELTMYEICKGMVEMVDGISNVYVER